MFIKYICMAVILACSSLLGFYLSKLDEYRLKELLSVKKMAIMLASEIEYSSSLVAALEHIAGRLDAPLNNWVMDIAVELSKRTGKPLVTIWNEKCEVYVNQAYLTDSDWEYIRDFGKNLGYLDKSMQHKNIRLFIDYLDDEIVLINNSKDNNKKMYRSLGILMGLLVVIVLI
ncbi:stage III sporulation protein AB [Vallitalea okinawensis]|uniref:stage III sporulation protein AB n=1 Tax=Vallitalea okinawensis TaxID=2078660 RepID=UPI001300B663|nr:stage III sporulation protein AB [Vallitalea okinawensis]